ncbi:Transmembrane protein 94 [Liparis tanakae]|uniref:Transmembrane protein 94 n=1 Tax=Liparis tanakae TaxID=230148 RepID=A0A4Z2GAL5_9TELE|nr:Transmembrane protein 94 [Liparis tanakae]
MVFQARHTTYGIRKCFLFLLQCQLSLVFIQFLACLAQLPPPMNTTDILWLSCFSCPLLSVSFLGKPPDSLAMTVATGKNLDAIPRKTQNYFLGCFLLKFGLTVCAYLLAFGFTLQEVCCNQGSSNSSQADNTTHVYILAASSVGDAPDWFGELSNGLLLTQKVMAGLLSQLVQATVDYQLWRDRGSSLTFDLGSIPLMAWLLVSLSPLLVVMVNEVVKLHEIRYEAGRRNDGSGL